MELVGYAQPCVAHPGGTVDVKVSSTAPEFTAEVVRLGLQAEPAAPPVGGRFPGRYQELLSGSYLVADLSEEEPATAGQTATLWFCPTWLPGPQCLMAGQARDGGWELGIGEDHRVSVAVRAASDAPPRGHSPARCSRPGTGTSPQPAGTAAAGSPWWSCPAAPGTRSFRPPPSSRPMPDRMTSASPAQPPSSSASAPRSAGPARTGASTGRSTLRDCSRAACPPPAWPPSRLTHQPRASAACATSGALARTRRSRPTGSATRARAGATERSSTRPRWA